MQTNNYDGIALFSGGLDSILAVKLLEEQGLKIKCLHFVAPFFGKPEKLERWRRIYGVDVEAVDIAEDFASLLRQGPAHGFGSVLNPCVDCKVLLVRKAAELVPAYGAKFIASGEVLGQRPMSQRRDTLNIIRRDGGVKNLLLRPLCAQLMDPTEAELTGLVDRSKLLNISGRGRKRQMELAAAWGIREIPTPAGGCLLTETENGRSFWPVLRYTPARGDDFRQARSGRQCWSFKDGAAYWLCIGRNNDDNAALHAFAGEGDITFKVRDYPGPLALLRRFPTIRGAALDADWPDDVLGDAAAFAASFSGKASRAGAEGAAIAVRAHSGPKGLDGPGRVLEVAPGRTTAMGWAEFPWERAREEIRQAYRVDNSE